MKMRKWEILVFLLLAAGLGVWALWPKSAGNTVAVQVDGEEIGTYSLSEARSLPLVGHGGYSLTVVIEDGQARVEDSTCPDLICQHHAPISDAGEQIVCLPARIVVTATGEEGAVDAIAE